jgi:hypothetical protein
MAEFYIPKLGDVIRLSKPWVLKTDGFDWKDWRRFTGLAKAHGIEIYKNNLRTAIEIELPAGTCIVFKRLFFSSQARKSEITCAIFAHEKLELTPKVNGGTAYMGNLRFEVTPDELNGIEYERVDR